MRIIDSLGHDEESRILLLYTVASVTFLIFFLFPFMCLSFFRLLCFPCVWYTDPYCLLLHLVELQGKHQCKLRFLYIDWPRTPFFFCGFLTVPLAFFFSCVDRGGYFRQILLAASRRCLTLGSSALCHMLSLAVIGDLGV